MCVCVKNVPPQRATLEPPLEVDVLQVESVREEHDEQEGKPDLPPWRDGPAPRAFTLFPGKTG